MKKRSKKHFPISPPLQFGGGFLLTFLGTHVLSLEVFVEHAHAVWIEKVPGLLGANTLLCAKVVCGVAGRGLESENDRKRK